MYYLLGIILSAITYLILAAFIAATIVKTATLFRAARTSMAGIRNVSPVPGLSCPAALKTGGDILFFIRLLETNDVLWAGEWLFHFSLLFVVIRHLRYGLYPVPGCVVQLQTAGKIAGYLLPAALLYVLVIKRAAEKTYRPLYNLFLLVLLLSLCATGLLMGTAARVDIVGVKEFILGIMHFTPRALPASPLFLLHFTLFLLLILYLPTHIIAAPLIMLEARVREDRLKRLFNEEKSTGDKL
jgi:nitrate reductase gamma subunit